MDIDIDIDIDIYLCIYIYGAILNGKQEQKPRQFYLPVYCLLIVQTEVSYCPSIYKETNGSYPFSNGLNRLKRLSHLCVYVAYHISPPILLLHHHSLGDMLFANHCLKISIFELFFGPLPFGNLGLAKNHLFSRAEQLLKNYYYYSNFL